MVEITLKFKLDSQKEVSDYLDTRGFGQFKALEHKINNQKEGVVFVEENHR